jgi:hypothetical protein
MRAGWAYFAAWPDTAKDFAQMAKTKLTMPVLSIAGEKASAAILVPQMKLVAKNVTAVNLKDTGHWLMEERPDETMEALIAFLSGQSSKIPPFGMPLFWRSGRTPRRRSFLWGDHVAIGPARGTWLRRRHALQEAPLSERREDREPRKLPKCTLARHCRHGGRLFFDPAVARSRALLLVAGFHP